MPYDIQEHKHRYAAWAASSAANTKTCRFAVAKGKRIIEDIGLHHLHADPNQLPEPGDLDRQHRQWREDAQFSAASLGLDGFTHGIAAKLINMYLKGVFVCGGHEAHPKVAALHPPIDALLLGALSGPNAGEHLTHWSGLRKAKWSKFSSEDYENVIGIVRQTQAGDALWKIEEHWRGYQ